jgi:hypothetical protein
MTLEDIKIVSYNRTTAKRFGYWVRIKDYRRLNGRMARLGLIRFLESTIGPLGERWQYTKYSSDLYEIKFNDEHDLLIFLLKAQRD